ncbi:hypothetical protein NMG60_11025573 [Bertholletia excelsa]
MSSFNIAKKLLPAKKAWKSFTKSLNSKFQKLKNSKSLERISLHLQCLRPRNIRQKLKALSGRGDHHSLHLRRHYSHHLRIQKNSAAVFVDELFADPVSLHSNPIHPHKEVSKACKDMGGTSGESKILVTEERSLKRKGKAIDTGSSSHAASSLPRFQCIDERAEEFISKIKGEMKLEREQSILEFQEMLARSA